MTDTQPYAKHGKVYIPAEWDSEFSVGYTIDEALALIGSLKNATREAADQFRAIEAACTEGHAWGDGFNSAFGGEKETVYHCTREGCEERRIDPGWLPFEPKQHVVPYSSKLWDCTGPGCEWCADESYADLIDRALKQASNCLPYLGEAFGGPSADVKPLEVKKLGYQWTIDASPEQIQAALDARNFRRHVAETLGPSPLGDLRDPRRPLPKVEVKAAGPVWPEPATGGPASIPLAGERQGCGEPPGVYSRHIPAQSEVGPFAVVVGPNVPEGAVYAVGSCSCGHSARYHGKEGCLSVSGFAGPECPCDVPVSRLASKATGTGEQP